MYGTIDIYEQLGILTTSAGTSVNQSEKVFPDLFACLINTIQNVFEKVTVNGKEMWLKFYEHAGLRAAY